MANLANIVNNIVSDSGVVVSSLVPTTRTITINGTTYDLSADRTYTITPSASARAEQNFTATAGQTTFTITGGYVVGLVDVFINGARLLPTDYTATNGTTVVLGTGALLNDAVTVLNYTSTIAALPTSRDVIDYTATSAQTTFTVSGGYTVGLLDVYVNGSKLTSAEFTATNGTTFVLTVASVTGDEVQAIRYNASVTGISGSGTANYVPKFTASQTVGNSLIFDNGTAVGIGVTPSAWASGTFPRVLQVGNASLVTNNAAFAQITNNMFFDGTSYKYITTNGASRIVFESGDITFNNVGSGTAGNTASTVERMRITSTGNVLVGTSTDRATVIGGTGTGQTIGGSGTPNLAIWNTGNTDWVYSTAVGNDGTVYHYNKGNTPIYFYTNATERMRLLANGDVKLNTSGMFYSNNSVVAVAPGGTTIFTPPLASGMYLVSYVIGGNPSNVGYAIVGNRYGSTLYILASGAGSQTALSVSGLNLVLSQSASGSSLNASVSYIILNSGAAV